MNVQSISSVKRVALALVASTLAWALPAAADLGEPDPTWGNGNMVNESFGCLGSHCTSSVQAMVPRPQGKLLLLVQNRYSIDLSHHGVYYSLVQRNADGSLDKSFLNGIASSEPPEQRGALDVQADGKMVVAGLRGLNCGPGGYDCEQWLAVMRITPDNQFDASFGTNGYFLLNEGGKPVSALRVLADGRLIVVTDSPRRLTATGQLDLSYGSSGKGAALAGTRVLVLPDGRVLSIYPTSTGFGLIRVDVDGNPDATFNGSGSREYPVPGGMIAFGSLALQGDRMLVAANDPNSTSNLLIRILPDGSLDPTFGTDGMRQTQAGGDIALLSPDAQGRIVGMVTFNNSTHFVRWAGDGSDEEIVGPSVPYFGTAGPDAMVLLDNSKAVLANGPITTRFGRNALQSEHEFVLQQYRDFLSREGDAAGVDYWRIRLVNGGTTRAALATSFLESPEFQGRVAPVARLYFAYFLRVPDYGGLLHWVTFADQYSLAAVSDAFASSTEFVNRYGSTDNAGFVQLVYQNVLGRTPDPGGQTYWVAQLDSGARTRGQVMLAFSEGEEFRASSGNETLVAITYAGMLRREPEADGYAYWIGYLDSGRSLLDMVSGFLSTPEYRSRFLP